MISKALKAGSRVVMACPVTGKKNATDSMRNVDVRVIRLRQSLLGFGFFGFWKNGDYPTELFAHLRSEPMRLSVIILKRRARDRDEKGEWPVYERGAYVAYTSSG